MSVNRDFMTLEEASISPMMHFILVAKIGGIYCPLVMVAQTPPDAHHWMFLKKEFSLDRIKALYQMLNSTQRHCGVAAELELAMYVYGVGRDNVPGASGNVPASRLLSAQEREALKRDPYPARFPWLAYHFLQIVKDRPVRALGLDRLGTKYWGLVPLNTTFTLRDEKNQAVVFDITDLDKITMGILGDVLSGDRGQRTMLSVEDWCGKQRVAEFDSSFPEIPLIDQGVLASKLLNPLCPPPPPLIFPRMRRIFACSFANRSIVFWPRGTQKPRGCRRLSVRASSALITLIMNEIRDDGYISVANVGGITANMLAVALSSEAVREAVVKLSFSSAIFSGPKDQAGFKKMTFAIREMPGLRKIYIADPPEPEPTPETRARTLAVQQGFRAVFQLRCHPDITLGMTNYSSEYALWLQT